MIELWTLASTTFGPTSPTFVAPSSGTPQSLGFEVESFWPPDRPNYAHFKSAGGATFAVMEAEGRGARFNFTIDDPDALWIELKDKVAVVEPLFDTPYGTRKFTISDLDGNELGFVRDPAEA